MKDHIVIVGLGQVGWRVLESIQQYERDVLVIEREAGNRNIEGARQLGATVIVDDPRDSDALEKACVAE